jgi:hypothetical protein
MWVVLGRGRPSEIFVRGVSAGFSPTNSCGTVRSTGPGRHGILPGNFSKPCGDFSYALIGSPLEPPDSYAGVQETKSQIV